jgi:hypothetical protein
MLMTVFELLGLTRLDLLSPGLPLYAAALTLSRGVRTGILQGGAGRQWIRMMLIQSHFDI